MFCSQLSVFFVSGIYIIIHLSGIQPSQSGICSNVSKGEPLMCCKNYRVVGHSCEECWPGTYGVDCNEKCPPNFYGRICKEMCSCSPCDNVRGCSNGNLSSFNYNGSSSNLQAIYFPIMSTGSFTFCVLRFLLF
ncbi:uncharacterized protein LOC111099149 [Crassostrea virginica]